MDRQLGFRSVHRKRAVEDGSRSEADRHSRAHLHRRNQRRTRGICRRAAQHQRADSRVQRQARPARARQAAVASQSQRAEDGAFGPARHLAEVSWPTQVRRSEHLPLFQAELLRKAPRHRVGGAVLDARGQRPGERGHQVHGRQSLQEVPLVREKHMTILVTGGSGFLGSHIIEQLSQAGRPVRALLRRSSDTKFLRSLSNVELVDGAIDDRASLERAVAGVEAVVHSAGLVKARNLDEFMRVNARGTENLLAACLPLGNSLKRFVQVSSIAVGGPSDAYGNPFSVDATPRPVTDYGRSKLAAERAVLSKQDQLKVTVIRPPAIYG